MSHTGLKHEQVTCMVELVLVSLATGVLDKHREEMEGGRS